MTTDLILAVDQGTTYSKALLVDRHGEIVATASARVPVRFPAPGWVETDGSDLWASVKTAIRACLRGTEAAAIAAVAIANQRESVLVWDRRTGKPLGPCISWQCRRTAPACDALRNAGYDTLVRERTGLAIDPLFSASKARWLLDRVTDAEARVQRGDLCIGTVDSWLTWNLTAGDVFATDLTNASRTQLLDIDRGCWDEGLLDIFRVPNNALPTLRGSSAQIGATRGALPIADGVPIAALIGDSHASLFGHGAPRPGTVKATYGTGTSIMTVIPESTRTARLSTTVAWSIEAAETSALREIEYALEGNITATGAGLEWMAATLGHAGGVADLEHHAASVSDSGGAYLVPAFAGLGAPHWDADARGLISGLTRGTTPAHLARAAFDAIAYQVRDVIDVLRDVSPAPSELIADGGAARSSLLMQMQADVLDLPILRAGSSGAAGLGAAYLAGLAIGWWASVDAIRALPRRFDRFEPDPRATARAEAGYRGWREALLRASGRPAYRAIGLEA